MYKGKVFETRFDASFPAYSLHIVLQCYYLLHNALCVLLYNSLIIKYPLMS